MELSEPDGVELTATQRDTGGDRPVQSGTVSEQNVKFDILRQKILRSMILLITDFNIKRMCPKLF